MKLTYNFFVVGCGGTGTFFLKEFSRYLAAKNPSTYTLSIIDGDVVEDKNLERQGFMEMDIGRPKATCFSEALNECFGINSVAYPQYLDTVEELMSLLPKKNSYGFKNCIPVIIGCVDNHRARQVMHKVFQKAPNCIYIDSANEYSSGEVVTGVRLKRTLVSPDRTYYFPQVMKSREKRASEHSCGVVNKTDPQHIVTNMMAGNILLSQVAQLMEKGKLIGGVVYFDAFKCETVAVPYLPNNSKEVMEGETA